MNVLTPLHIVQKNAFSSDPFFKDCWEVLLKERESEARKSFCSEDKSNHDTIIPWKWNNMGRVLEFLRHKLPVVEKSCEVDTDAEYYKLLLDVQHFDPVDLSITVTDRTINIQGKHEEQDCHLGTVSRHFSRRFTLPSDVIMGSVTCHMSSDAVLQITARRSFKNRILTEAQGEIKHSFTTDNLENDFEAIDSGSLAIEDGGRKSPKESSGESRKHSLQTIPDFDMVPFWARDLTTNTQFGIKSDLVNFKVVIDMGQFTAEEVTVYTTRYYIKVEGKHEEKQDAHGFITRKFTRKYWAPKGLRGQDIRCQLSRDGVLEITAPMPKHGNEGIDGTIRLPVVLIEEDKVQKWIDQGLV